jgi:hypothetical protein
MRRLLLAGAVAAALVGSPDRAQALTIRDIIELTRAGLGEEVLLALIEVDRGVYPIDPATLKQLKAAGVGDRVLVALVRSGRETPVEVPAPVPTDVPNEEDRAAQVVVIDHRDQPVERIREVPVAVPVFIPVSSSRHRHRLIDRTFDASDFVPFQSGPPAARPVRAPAPEPVYWGWGGKRRPETWDPSPGEVKPPDRRK